MRIASWVALACMTMSGSSAFGPDLSEVCPSATESYVLSDLNVTEAINYCEVSTIYKGLVALCIQKHFSRDAGKLWKKFAASYYCSPDHLEDYETTLANATLYRTDPPTNISDTVYAPFDFPDEIYEPWYETIYAYYDNVFLAQTYGWIIIVAGCFVMAVAGILRLVDRMSRTSGSSGVMVAIQKYITEPALFGKAHAHRPKVLGFHLSIPTRLESIFLAIYIVVNVVLCFAPFDLFIGNFYFAKKSDQFNRYVADRSGILSFAQYPFLFAFAGRNTIFLWITGWSYQSFSVFHKWVARVCVWQAFLHTIMYTLIGYLYGGFAYYKEEFTYAYWRWGVAAMTAGFCLVTLSVYSIRKVWYEVFVFSHILFAITWLISSYYHVALLEESNYFPWLWTAIAFWVFDRSVRLIRLLVINLAVSKKNRGGLTEVAVLEDSVLQLTIPVPSGWKSSPGQYVFLYFPSFKFWQSHPFTIVNVTSPEIKSCSSAGSHEEASVQVDKSGIAGVSTTELTRPSTTVHKEMTIVFRAHKGVTQDVLAKALQEGVGGGGKFHTKALIEGPYGASHDLTPYDRVILVAAGLGITACLPFLMHLTTSTSLEMSGTGHQEIVLHWIIRHASSISWFRKDFHHALRASRKASAGNHGVGSRVRIVVHVTSREAGTSDMAPRPMGDDGILVVYPATVPTIASEKGHTGGRPSVHEIMEREVHESSQSARIAIVSCGPGGMSDDCRQSVVDLLDRGRTIRYFEESFTW